MPSERRAARGSPGGRHSLDAPSSARRNAGGAKEACGRLRKEALAAAPRTANLARLDAAHILRRRFRMRESLALLLALAGGCATARPGATLSYTDRNLFWLRHQGAQVASADTSFSPVDGGRITGEACGVDLLYDVWRGASSVNLTGFVHRAQPGAIDQIPTFLVVRDRGGVRTITGSVGDRVGTNAVDFRLTGDGLSGRIALRRYDLHAEGDDLVGSVRGIGIRGALPFVAHGRAELLAMPAEDQAVVLPFLLACSSLRNGVKRLDPQINPVLEVDLRSFSFDTPPPVAPPGQVGPATPSRF